MSFGSLNKIKAGKKVYRCSWCWEDIAVGEPRVNYFGEWEYELQNWHMHPDCYEAFDREDDGSGELHDEKHQRGMTCGEMLDKAKVVNRKEIDR